MFFSSGGILPYTLQWSIHDFVKGSAFTSFEATRTWLFIFYSIVSNINKN